LLRNSLIWTKNRRELGGNGLIKAKTENKEGG